MEEEIVRAVGHLNTGHLERAVGVIDPLLEREPNNPQAIYVRGVLHYSQEEYEEACRFFRKAIVINDKQASFFGHLALALNTLGRKEEAEKNYVICLELDPHNLDALTNFVNLLQDQRRFKEAEVYLKTLLEASPDKKDTYIQLAHGARAIYPDDEIAANYYKKAFELYPGDLEVGLVFGIFLLQTKKYELAAKRLEQTAISHPQSAKVLCNLGLALFRCGRHENAIPPLIEALRLNSRMSEAHVNLFSVLVEIDQLNVAINFYSDRIKTTPDDIFLHYYQGKAFAGSGDVKSAIECFSRACNLNNAKDEIEIYTLARFSEALTLPVLYQTSEELEEFRRRFCAELGRLDLDIELDTQEQIDAALGAIVESTNFFLHYQSQNDTELQKRYGELLSRIVSAGYPNSVKDKFVEHDGREKKWRIGFISSFLHNHSVSKLYTSWICDLDERRFETYTFHTGKFFDPVTKLIEEKSDHFYTDIGSYDDIIGLIESKQLDVLIFFDIGMDPKMQLLANLRLAPVQCTTYGHPVTSGFKNVDYYLSSDLMEPENGDEHYTETLIRLPHLASRYRFPPIKEVREEEVGSDERPILFCPQSLYKMIPEFDYVYPAIAERIGQCQFGFIADNRNLVTDRFRKRLERAFSKFGKDANEYCVIHPKMSWGSFLELNQQADVFLDSFMWVGCNSTLEALACNLPVVTLPGPMMRGRHTYAMLKILEMEETIAKDMDDYLNIAVRMATDGVWRESLRQKIEKRKSRLFEDRSFLPALNEFLLRAIEMAKKKEAQS